MTTVVPRPSDPVPVTSGRRGALGDVASALPVALGAAGATWWLAGVPATHVPTSLGLYAAMAGLIVLRFPDGSPGPGLGVANRVTLARAALAVPIGGLALAADPLDGLGYWWVIALSTTVMILDGLDGRVARRTDTATAFGARFDMELDAALIMALSVLVWASGKVGMWVLLIGLMRYVFVAVGLVWPALRAELPESFRRKAVCVAQGVVLLVALGPIIPGPFAVAVTAAGLVALSCSFALDVRWALASASARHDSRVVPRIDER